MKKISLGPKSKRRNSMPAPQDLFLALGSGCLLIFSFPKFGTGLLAWISLAPLFFALRGKNLSQCFLLGLIAGLTAQIGIIYWITYVVVNYGYLPYAVGIAAMLLLSFYLSLYMGLFAGALGYFQKREVPLWITAPLLWTCLEYAKSHLLTGFPWENLGYSQYLFLPVIQIADTAGVYGISFLIVVINALIYEALMAGKNKKLLLVKILTVAGILVLICTYGFWRIQEMNNLTATSPRTSVRIVQGNIDQSVKWNPRYQRETIEKHAALSLPAGMFKPQLIVWPETAFPAFFQDGNDLQRVVTGLAIKTGAWFLFGSPAYAMHDKDITLFNSAYLLSPIGAVIGRYDKVHLVPYGEYVPLRKYFPFINKLVVGIGDFGTGPGYHPLPMDDAQRLGVLICYEGIFPGAARNYKLEGADFLVNLTNDAWFGRTSAPWQHLSMTVFRAVENRLDVVRAANTGISALITATGKIDVKTNLFEPAFLDTYVHRYDKGTFYSAHGDIFVYLCMTILILLSLTIIVRRKRYD